MNSVGQEGQAELFGFVPWICRAQRHYPWPKDECPNCGPCGMNATEDPAEFLRLMALYEEGGPVRYGVDYAVG